MEQLIKFWEFFNSKKTAIGAILFAVADILTAAGYPEYTDPVKNIAYAFTGTGLGHKAVKAVKN